MAPPKTYNEANPAIVPFEKVSFMYPDDNGNQVVIEDYSPTEGSGYEILTDDVLNSGNLELLYNFRTKNQNKLNDPRYAPAKRYLDARIKNAERFQAYENKAKLFAALGKKPPQPIVMESQGYIGIPNLQYRDYQTSGNGCWSVAYSTLLRSRGVDISQEEIRQWRPDYKENARIDQKANKERKVLMNTDAPNSIYANADLVEKVLPNTAVGMLSLQPFAAGQLSINGQPLSQQQQQIVMQEYLEQVREKLVNTVMRSLTEHRSPVAVSVDDHYVTITGISTDGSRIVYEDSLGADTNARRTKTMSVDNLVYQAMLPHRSEGRILQPKGIELTWLSDLPVSEHGKPQPNLDADNCVTADQNGTVSVNIPLGNDSLQRAGNPSQGQVTSSAVEQQIVLDQTRLAQKLNGARVEGWGAGGGIMFGSTGTAYPGRVMHLGDRRLLREAISSQLRTLSGVYEGLGHLAGNGSTQAENAKAAEFRNALEELQNAATGKNVDIDQAREKLAGMYDFLLEKPQGSNQTRFESKFGAMSKESRQAFVENLYMLSLSLGLDKEKASERFEALHNNLIVESRRTQELAQVENRFYGNIADLWNTVQENAPFRNMNGSAQQGQMRFALASIAANFAALQNNRNQGKNPPYPNEHEVAVYLEHYLNSDGLRETMKGTKPWMTDKAKGPMDFLRDLADTEKRVMDEKADTLRYAIPKRSWKLRRRLLQDITNAIRNDGTGSYTGLGLISRKKNSDEFERAKNAMIRIADAPENNPPSAKSIKTAVGRVLAYLDGKEEKRDTPFGRNRWNSCMRFLAETMPRKDFEAYCSHINQVRGVQPGHKDFVGPENFYLNAKSSYVMKDSINRIANGQDTLRDFARVIAIRNLETRQTGSYQGTLSINSEEMRRQLCVETENIMRDPHFKSLMENSDRQLMVGMLHNGGTEFYNVWQTHKTLNMIREQAPETKPDANQAFLPKPGT